jgi:hypothetical protein
VGIGTNNPLAKLVVSNAGAQNIEFGYSAGLSANFIQSINRPGGADVDMAYYLAGSGVHRFFTNANERMRIDSSGNLLVGHTGSVNVGDANTRTGASIEGGGNGTIYASRASSAAGLFNRNSDGTLVLFNRSGTTVGSVSVTTTGTLYNITSDQRLKENIQDAAPASALIDAIQVRQYDWKSDGSHQRYGFVAQELVTVAPEAVHQPTNPDDMMAVDYSKLVPMLVKEIQSLRQRLTALEQK